MSARPAKVLRIITRLNIGGPSLNAIALSAGLPTGKFDTALVCGRPGPGEGDMIPRARERGIRVVEVPSMQRELAPWADAASLVRILRIVRRERPDIIHTHLAKAGMLGRLAARAFPRTKTVHTFHGHVFSGYFTPKRTRVFLAIERWLARGTDRIIALTGSQKEELVGKYRIGRAEQYEVIPLGFDLARFEKSASLRGELRREIGIGPGDPVIAMVGRLTGIKDHTLFLAAARRVREVKPRAVFLVVGDGPRRAEIEQEARAPGLGGSVRFTGWRGDLERVYADADVVALTSVNEGTPVCLIEAAAAGRPVVSTAVGGVADVVRDGVSGFLAAERDPGEIASLILRILDDPARAAAMGEEGRRIVLGRFTEARLVRDMENLYERLLHGKG